MKIKLPYGKTFLSAEIPEKYKTEIISPTLVKGTTFPINVVEKALNSLCGQVKWQQFENSKTVAIAINDKTRPVPHHHLLPPLLKKLKEIGIPKEAITFYIAVGTHDPMLDKEFDRILPLEIIEDYKIISHNAYDKESLKYLGQIDDIPVWINKDYYNADLKIVVGNIEPHIFVGFSGGVKTAVIGLGGIDTINKHHKLLTDPSAKPGEYESNPLRIAIEKIGRMVKIDIALNVLLNGEKEIIHAYAGDPIEVMKKGIEQVKKTAMIKINSKYDLVIASQGGYPKDINMYQSQKALLHAAMITKENGHLILVTECLEGVGSDHYKNWMIGKTSHQQAVTDFLSQEFEVGPHKAFLISRDAMKVKLYTISELDENIAYKLLLNPRKDLQKTIDVILNELPDEGKICVLTHASNSLPFMEEE